MKPAGALVSPPLLGRLPAFVRRTTRGPVVRSRHRVLEREDAQLSHYPKSGNTWLRFLIVALAAPEIDLDFRNVNTLIPAVRATGASRRLPCGGRLLTSHGPLGNHVGHDRPVIDLVRDPRDVASYFAHACRHGWDSNAFEPFAKAFLAGEVDNYGTWRNHAGQAIRIGRHNDLTVVLYEDLVVADTKSTLAPVASKLGLLTTDDHLEAASDRCSRERMRSLDHTIENRPSTRPFVRRLADPRWPDLATPRLEEQFADVMAPEMKASGYAV